MARWTIYTGPTNKKVIEVSGEYNLPLYLIFIYYIKAFDTEDQSSVLHVRGLGETTREHKYPQRGIYS